VTRTPCDGDHTLFRVTMYHEHTEGNPVYYVEVANIPNRYRQFAYHLRTGEVFQLSTTTDTVKVERLA